jgi:pectate lyase
VDGRGADISIERPTGGDRIIFNLDGTISNLFFTHLKIRNSGADPVRIGSYSRGGSVSKVWFNHISFDDPGPGFSLCDIRADTDEMLFSWCHYFGGGQGMLISSRSGSNDADYQPESIWDSYPLPRITFHHCRWQVSSRQPKCRHSLVHQYNSLFEDWTFEGFRGNEGTDIAGVQASVAMENCIAHKTASSNNLNIFDSKGLNSAGMMPSRSIGTHLLTGNAAINPSEQSSAFLPSDFYSYTAETADEALRTEIQNNAGWINEPFPGG